MSGDLHCHTRLSDGTLGIEDLINFAKKKGLETIAITDHDCLAGTVRGKIIGARHGIQVIPGVELSATDEKNDRNVHILCYLPDAPDMLEGLCKRNSLARKKAAHFMMLQTAKRFPISTDFITRSFLEYAKVKGELVKGIEENDGTLIYNSDDPTIVGLFKEIDFKGDAISFGLEDEPCRVSSKPCWCGRDIEINELISGCGTFECECGIKYEKPMYLAKNISLKDRTFTLESPEGETEFTIALDGLHNVYNAVGAIIAARRFLKLSDEEIQKAIDLGLVPEALQGDYDTQISYAEFCGIFRGGGQLCAECVPEPRSGASAGRRGR